MWTCNYFTFARPSPSALRMPGDFPFLTTDVSDEFLCVCVCSEHSLSDGDVDRRSLGARSRPLTEMLPLSRLRSFGNLLFPSPSSTRSGSFCTCWAKMDEASLTQRSGYELALRYKAITFGLGASDVCYFWKVPRGMAQSQSGGWSVCKIYPDQK